jgi:shikimate dehydrogenase
VKAFQQNTCVNVDTKLVGLLGNPLGHSFSPVMHNTAFQTLGLNYVYLPIEVPPDDLKDVAVGISKMNFAGYNITIPHKVRIMEHLDRIDELALFIGAVNTVVFEDGVATGYNTDGEGFIRSLAAETGMTAGGKRCFILGCGGTARAIAMTLAFQGAGNIFICNRTRRKAIDLADEINTNVRPCSEAITWTPGSIQPAIRRSDIFVNTTSIGMYPDEDRTPIDIDMIPDHLVVYDIVYNPVRTQLLKAAAAKGCRVVNGLGMLVYQGAEGFRRWTGIEPPVGMMFEVVRGLNE